MREPRPHRPDWSSPLVGTVDAPVRIERPGSWEATDGFTDSPSRGTAELGHTFLRIGIDKLTEAVANFYEESIAD